MLCPKCKAENTNNAIFCNQCGKKIVTTKKTKVKSRGNGTGTAFKRGNTWTAQVVYDRVFVADDKPMKKLTRSKGGFKTKEEALRYCPILKNGPQKQKEVPTLLHYWNAYQDTGYKNLGKSKKQAYRTAWKKLEKLGTTRMDQFTISDFQSTIDEKCSTYYPAKDCRTLLTNLFAMAAAEGYVRADLPTYISIPSLEETEQIPFSETEQVTIWKKYEEGDIRAAKLLLMIYTGMMPGEAMKLKVDQIDIPGRRITGAGIKTKVRKKTDIVLADSIIPVVQDLIDHAQKSGYIWKQNELEWYADYHQFLADAGCRDLPPYSCRHTTATALAIDRQIAPQTIKRVMRWSSTKMLDRYAHPDNEDALAAVNTLAKTSED